MVGVWPQQEAAFHRSVAIAGTTSLRARKAASRVGRNAKRFSAPIRRVTLRKNRHGSPGAGTHPDHQPIAIIGSGSRGYGLGRFPVTLYKAQSEKPLGEVDNIRKFLDENADKLAVKE